MKIKYVEYGLANRFDKYIEINRDLKKFPLLLKYVREHEINHTDKTFSIQDLIHDLRINQMVIPLIDFVIKHPKTWIDFFPITIRRRKWTKDEIFIDYNLLILYIFAISVLLLTIQLFL